MQKSCPQCQTIFQITASDLAFYDKVSPIFNGQKYLIPPPTLCPDCRAQKRYAWRNCQKCKSQIQTSYAPDRPEIVYCEPCYLKEVY